MENTRIAEEIPTGPIRWKSAAAAGLTVGVIFLVLVRGLPWFSSGLLAPGVMGRQVAGDVLEGGGASELGIGLLHLIVSIGYALVIAPLVHRLNIKLAVTAGAGIGLGLYLLNLLIFTMIYPQDSGQRELAPLIIHIIFGMSAAAAYKGLSKRAVVPA